jgi:hypothetical protein
MASEGQGQDDELGVRLDWPGDDTGFARRPDATDAAESGSEVDELEPADAETSTAPDSEPDDGQTVPAPIGNVPLLPALVGRLDNVNTTISTLAMRIDALGATTNNFHTVFTERLSDYIDTVAHLTRSQQEVLEEYRHGNDRTVAELRRAVAESDALLRHVAGRIDEVVTDIASLSDGERAPAGTNDGLIAQMNEELATGFAALRDDIAQLNASSPETSDDLATEVAGLREEIVQLKRRIGVRAKAPAVLDDAQLAELLERIVDRVGPRAFAEEDVRRVAQAVVSQLEQFLEVVPDTPAPANAAPAAPAAPPKPAPTKAAGAPKPAKKKAAGTATSSRRRSS